MEGETCDELITFDGIFGNGFITTLSSTLFAQKGKKGPLNLSMCADSSIQTTREKGSLIAVGIREMLHSSIYDSLFLFTSESINYTC